MLIMRIATRKEDPGSHRDQGMSHLLAGNDFIGYIQYGRELNVSHFIQTKGESLSRAMVIGKALKTHRSSLGSLISQDNIFWSVWRGETYPIT